MSLFELIKYQLSYNKIMNRSIAKTRNELERITLKINQLKTKYTTDNIVPGLSNGESSPLSHSRYREKEFLTREAREQPVSTFQNKQSQVMQASKNSISVTLNPGDEMYQRQFKIFRNEIYNYIDKCLLLSKEREEELVERALQECMNGSRVKKGRFSMEERIKKIQEETTNCLASIQDAILQIKKNEKYFNDKITHTENKTRKEIKELEEKIPKQKDYSSQFLLKLASAEKQLMQFRQESKTTATKIQNLTEMIEEVTIKQQNGEKRMHKRIEQVSNNLEQFSITKFSTLQDQIQKYNVFNVKLEKQIIRLKDQLENKIVTIEKNKQKQEKQINFNEKFVEKVEQIVQKQIQSVQAPVEDLKIQIYKEIKGKSDLTAQKIAELTEQAKQIVEGRAIGLQEEISKNCSDIASVAETVLNLEQKTEQLSNLYSSFKQMLHEKVSQSDHNIVKFKSDFQKRVEEIMLSLSQIKLSINNTQSKTEQISIKLAQSQKQEEPIQMQNRLRETIYAQISKLENKLEQEHSRHLVRIETVDTLLSQNEQRMKTSPQSEMLEEECQTIIQVAEEQGKKNLDYVDQKLNQFENDINQTIKLLYEDIQNKVNEMLGHTGMMDFRADYQITKQNINQLQTRVNQISIRFKEKQNVPEAGQDMQKFKEQVYSEMGNKIQQLSSIMERTVEEMQTKVEKLDHNFSYIYERMSNIEYDNANFKDKLTYLLTQREVQRQSPSKIEIIHTQTRRQGSNILDVLGQLNQGKKFFEI